MIIGHKKVSRACGGGAVNGGGKLRSEGVCVEEGLTMLAKDSRPSLDESCKQL